MKLFFKWGLSVLLFLLLAACGNDQPQHINKQGEEDSETLDVFATVYPLQFLAEQIGGSHVNVKSIYPPGADEHTYEPSQKDMMHLADADVFFYIGLGLEGFADKAESILRDNKVEMLPLGEQLDLPESEHHDEEHDDEDHDGHHHGDHNPHVWLDPIFTKDLAKQITEALSELQPQNEAYFVKNYEAVSEKLTDLDEQFKAATEKPKRQEIVVSHAAYGYWEERYGIEQVALAGLSSTEEPSQKKLQQIVDLVREKHVPYLLSEQNINQKLIQVIQKETDTEVLMLHNLGVLTPEDIENKENYFTVMAKNIEVLEKALND